ncbi:hypothetical protein P4S72_29735 [Vibrio sp. PP-XX7]
MTRELSAYQDFYWQIINTRQKLVPIRFIFSNTTEAGTAYVETDKATDAPPSSFPAETDADVVRAF